MHTYWSKCFWLILWPGEFIRMHRFALVHHKCGTTYVKKVLEKISSDLNIDFHRYNYNVPGKYQQVPTGKKVFRKIKANLSMVFCKRTKPVIRFVDNSRYDAVFSKIKGDYKGFHIVRDPRDVIVSGYFSHRYSHPVDSPWGKNYLIEHRKWLKSVPKNVGFNEEIKRGYALNPMGKWNYNDPNILEIKFEELTQNPKEIFSKIFSHLEIRVAKDHLASVIDEYSFKRLSGGRKKGEENVNSHFRKGVPGDWKNHFNQQHINLFHQKWGGLLIKLGYEPNYDWALKNKKKILKKNFAILTYARSGSTSLTKSLRIHPDIKILGEPFHDPTNNNKKFWHIKLVNNRDSFISTLGLIYSEHNGINHKIKHVPFGYNKYIIESGNYKIIYLYRKNILRNVISEQISKQTQEWGTRKDKILNYKFNPIPLKEVSRRLHENKKMFSEYRNYLRSQSINYYDLSYEQLYGDDVDINKRMKIYYNILKFLGFHTDFTAEQVDRVRSILSPSTKLNSVEIYRRIPNIDHIEKEFGSQENGYLFK